MSIRWIVRAGDCVDVMARMLANSVDAVVTDPPYELGFMEKGWDRSGIANSVKMWRLVLRVLKPGGYLISFGGTRTYHRMACAVEDAGFEIRDQVQWMYGQGFPKSLNLKGDRKGWGTALKPAHEPLVLARKPLTEANISDNVKKWGTGALNVDGCRIAGPQGDGTWGTSNETTDPDRMFNRSPGRAAYRTEKHPEGRWPANVILSHAPSCVRVGIVTVEGRTINRYDDGAKPFGGGAGHPYSTKRMPDDEVEVWACVPDCPVRMLDAQSGESHSNIRPPTGKDDRGTPGFVIRRKDTEPRGHSDSGGASRFFYIAKASRREREEGLEAFDVKLFGQSRAAQVALKRLETGELGEPGQYVPGKGGMNTLKRVKNDHPTVKPVDLMRWLCRLVTPPGGVVLDPFCGSGSTGIAAVLEGFKFVGIDKEPHYCDIARARITNWEAKE